ncbi:MAG: glycoside hydrolase family 3 N-terminal domain-containing protein [Bacteroidota bacterium]|nr:glycoside hydrolase family 3 N-terminal domain-containing protein [Bacteroidota bacterium]
MRITIILLILLLQTFPLIQNAKTFKISKDLLIKINNKIKTDSIVANLSLDEKIGQLFMIATYSDKSISHEQYILKTIKKYHIGGLIFFKGHPYKQAKLTNEYQSISKIPLFIAMDAEWGVSMRLDSIISFPKQMTLGAIQNNDLIYQMGREVANQCKRLGVHINFAPVIDINTNPSNPVIHLRSFGEKREMVANKGIAYMKGMQDNGIIAVAKHFPGHGDADVDSHLDLPVIRHDKKRLNEIELFPFKKLIFNDCKGIMIAHLYIPEYEQETNTPSTLSKNIVTGLLIDKMKYNGLIFTDALNMQGVTKFYNPGEIEVKALLAGNDILLFPKNIAISVKKIKEAIADGTLSENEIDKKVKKIIIKKLELKLFEPTSINPKNIVKDLNSTHAYLLKRKLIEASITIVKNNGVAIPIKMLQNKKIVSVAIGPLKENKFQESLKLYTSVQTFQISKYSSAKQLSVLTNSLSDFNTIIVSLHSLSSYNVKTFGLKTPIINFVNKLKDNNNIILVNFGSPYALKFFDETQTILQAYQNEDDFQDLAAQALFGGIEISGKLPVSASKNIKYFDGITKQAVRLKYTIPEEIGIRKKNLLKIDTLVKKAMEEEAIPGCQILIAKNGKVFFHKSYGFHTYEKKKEVKNTDLYDIASISKITGTLLPIMRFYDIGILDLNDSIGSFFSCPSEYDYGQSTIKEMLTHQAGFKAWIAFYLSTLNKDKTINKEYYSKTKSEKFPIQVCQQLYTLESTKDTIWKSIYSTKIKKKGKYKYSDLDFLFLKRIVDTLTKQPFDIYLSNNFYSPLGMNLTCFNPLKQFSLSKIIPTENDKYFRNQIIHGNVHDPAAAMMGGIDGHAGIFSNTNDLAKYIQMLLNEGKYGGERYFSPQTVNLFTKTQSTESRRGLGFDKPVTDKSIKYSPTSRNAPFSTFGHTGFTGTCAWGDPDNDIIYIFLSNRTYPDAKNKKLLKMNTRTDIQRVIYEALKKNSTH